MSSKSAMNKQIIQTILQKEERLIFKNNLISINSLETLSVDLIHQSLNRDGFVCIRGLIDEAEIVAARQQLKERFSKSNDLPSVGEEPQKVQSNFQKLRVGTSPGYPLNTRLVRTIYNPLWEEDIYGMHPIFRKMVLLRNKLLGKDENFASGRVEDGVWTAARIQQYPLGGGFMSPHQDTPVTEVAENAGLNFFQLVLLMSQKGIDYEKGGGYIQRNNSFFLFEDFCNLGDIVIYNSSTIHGVHDIDPHKALDLDSFSGRVAAFVTLYKDLTGSTRLHSNKPCH
jgi:hypothetical protein